MKTVLLDKIASVTRACGLKREVRVSADIPCEEGVVVAVRVLNDKSTYSKLELPSGRMAQVKKGDVIAGALGHRHALFGYSGHLPERLAPGDIVSLLNMGGVIGICDSVNPDLGPPFECEVLGAVLHFPYLGETLLGIKGRVAFEAPAAEVLLTAHRELEKLVLTGRQLRVKETVAAVYGDLVHEGQHLDPVCRDIEALLLSSQERVDGEVHLLFRPGQVFVEGVESPFSLRAASRGVYGEAAGEWSAADARGFSRIVALPGELYARMAAQVEKAGGDS